MNQPVWSSKRKPLPTVGIGRQSRFLPQILCLLLFFAFIAGPLTARAASPLTARITEVIGPVSIIEKIGGRRTAKKGDRLTGDDTIVCGWSAKAVLRLRDGSRLELLENSYLKLNKLLPQEKTKLSFSLFFGRVNSFIKKLKGEDTIITPTMVAGVRGTDFTVSVAEDGASVLSVSQGQVAVSTEKPGLKAQEIKLGPGQEVQVNELGAALVARPIKLDDLKAWQEFRKQRLEKMALNLPEVVQGLDSGIDNRLADLKRLKAMPLDRAQVLKTLQAKLKKIPPTAPAQRARLIIQTHMEAANVLGLVRRFRIERMRLQTVFVQSQRLKEVLPLVAEPLRVDLAAADKGLAMILARKEEVQAQERLIAMEFEKAMDQVKPFLEGLKKK